MYKKFRTTKKDVMQYNKNVICLGCNVLKSLTYEYPESYTCGVYGWNSDNYRVDNDTMIIYGDRPFGNITPDYELIKKYNTLAAAVDVNNYEKAKKQFNELTKKFIKEVLQNE